ncbi:YfhO family protein [Streptomyces sp. Ag109_O5-10]|uniref:YfhO family protein n=1 Tax=Streptomyces sp. Ag109_O5-10 TaxID=1855349 RepID=UPI000894B466|nr:YfhO family protein [Streptomyces sp. Ag109_O5-10]SEF13912.1 membrane protein YfhO [Streptomyces sp. Ag109_O5-10]
MNRTTLTGREQGVNPARGDEREAGPVRRRSVDPRWAAAQLAAVLTTVAFCAADVVARSYPFGPRTRNVNDLGNQYVPFHAHLWDLLHGRADGGLLVNWQSGYGSSFLPDLGTYVSSPFALLVAVFPRDEIDLAVYTITVLKTAVAGAAMAWLLLSLRRGRWWGAGLLGASYALCGWSLALATFNPMWLDGLIALPLFCLVGEWATAGRRPLLSVLIVALAWIANFYTAYMATLGAALVLLLRLVLAEVPWRRALAVVGRAALTVALGIGLAAPLVVVVYVGTKHSYPGRESQFVPVTTRDLLARLLPTTYNYSSPGLYVGMAALLLALALPFHRAVPVRVRAGWTALVLAVALSLQWAPTSLAWHAFAVPNGSSYRQAFVLCALLVIAGWHALAYGPPNWRALGAAAVLLALVAAVASRSVMTQQHTHHTWPVVLLAVAGALAGLALLAVKNGRPALVGLAAMLLIGAQFGESAATAAVSTRVRLNMMDDYATWGDRQQRQADAVASADDWPAYRTEPGRDQTVANDPMMVGGQGSQYYSSLTSDVLGRTLAALGGGWTSHGRSLQSLDNPVTDAVFSVGARVHNPPDPHQTWLPQGGGPSTVTREDVPPLVTVRANAPHTTPAAFGKSPYRNQELLLGARVYTLPTTTPGGEQQGDEVRGLPVRGKQTLTAHCRAGSEVFLWAPQYAGTARLGTDGPQKLFRSDLEGSKRAAMQPLGTVPASGEVRIELTPNQPGRVPAQGPVGCLDTAHLRTAVQHLKSTGATKVTVSDGTVHAQLPAGSKGTAVVAAPRIAGWRCSAGGAEVAAGEFYGLIAVPLGASATSLTCTFHPPGLRLGAAVGGVSLLTLILLGTVPALRRRTAVRSAGLPSTAH